MSTQPRKEHLLNVAHQLFNEHGYHATGIDKILAEAGVSKATLYKYFPKKEALILQVLQRRHDQLAATFEQAITDASNQPFPALALFDVLDDWFNSDDFFGCNFSKASGEYPDKQDDIHQYAAWHKESVKILIVDSLPFNKYKNTELADGLTLLMDGAIIAAQVKGDKKAAKKAKKIAEALLISEE